MVLKILVLSEDSSFSSELQKILEQHMFLYNDDFNIRTCVRVADFRNILSQDDSELAILYFQLANAEKLESLVSEIHSNHPSIPLIFFTEDIGIMARLQRFHPYECFLSPLDPENIHRSIIEFTAACQKKHIFLNLKDTDGNIHVVCPRKIQYIETGNTRKRELRFYLSASDVLYEKGSLSAYAEALRPYAFLRINKNQLINLNQLVSVNHHSAVLSCGETFLVSRTFRSKFAYPTLSITDKL